MIPNCKYESRVHVIFDLAVYTRLSLWVLGVFLVFNCLMNVNNTLQRLHTLIEWHCFDLSAWAYGSQFFAIRRSAISVLSHQETTRYKLSNKAHQIHNLYLHLRYFARIGQISNKISFSHMLDSKQAAASMTLDCVFLACAPFSVIAPGVCITWLVTTNFWVIGTLPLNVHFHKTHNTADFCVTGNVTVAEQVLLSKMIWFVSHHVLPCG